jgi:hypothetical protein
MKMETVRTLIFISLFSFPYLGPIRERTKSMKFARRFAAMYSGNSCSSGVLACRYGFRRASYPQSEAILITCIQA